MGVRDARPRALKGTPRSRVSRIPSAGTSLLRTAPGTSDRPVIIPTHTSKPGSRTLISTTKRKSEKPKNKLRRARRFVDDGAIQSRLPTADSPHSRVVRPVDVSLDGKFVDLRHAPSSIALDDVLDRIVCGDSRSVLQRMPEGFAACAVTSPPYWNLVDYGVSRQVGGGSYAEYREDLKKVWRGVARALRSNGKFALNVPLMPLRKEVSGRAFGKTHTRYLLDLYSDLRADILSATDLLSYSLFIWEKQTTEKMFGSYPYPPNLYERNYIEFIAVFVKPGAPPKMPPSVKKAAKLTQQQWMELTKQIWWMYPENVPRKTGHPAPFPEALPNRLLSMYTFPRVDDANLQYSGDIVLDPFAGWGTTCVAAKRLGRRYVGIDLSTDFCRHAAARLSGTPVTPTVMTASPKNGAQTALFSE
jgi:modification methylase